MRRLVRPVMYLGVVGVVWALSEYHGRYIGDYRFVETSRFGWAAMYVVLSCFSAYGVGLPEVPRNRRSRLSSAIVAALLAALAVSLVQLFVGDALLPRFVVFGSAAALIPWYYAMSSLAGARRSALEQRDRVVVVGSDEFGTELTAELAANPEKPASVVGRVTEEEAAGGFNRRKPLFDLVVQQRASVVVLSGAAQSDERIVDQAAALHETGVRVRTRSLFYEEWLGKIPLADLGRVSLFFDIGAVHRDRYSRFKRVVDLAVGVIGLGLLSLLVPLVVVGNAVGNRGPLLYVQERVGRRGEVFRIYKFRSMRQDDDAATHWTVEGDPRVTPFGRFLRTSHLDELPQVWNVLKGDLSVVGPRPEQPQYVAELVRKLPFYDLRHIVRPGITGWAQVKYGYAGDQQGALEKLQYDFHYLRRQSLSFDLRILGRTIRSILGSEGRGR